MLESTHGGRHPYGATPVRPIGIFLLPMVVLFACDRGPVSTHHEAYVEGLREAGLADLPAGAAWIEAGNVALVTAEAAELPFRADGWFAEDSAEARAWRIDVQEGQRIYVRARLHGRASGRLFLEVYRLPQDTAEPLFALASADDTTRVLAVEAPRRATRLIVRLQPELLRGGRFELAVAADTLLAVTNGRNSTPPQPRLAGR